MTIANGWLMIAASVGILAACADSPESPASPSAQNPPSAAVTSATSSVVIGLGDPEPSPSIAPLEIILDRCLLNRDSVAPGRHDVALVGDGKVTFTDSAGTVLATLSEAGTIVTEDEVYTVDCVSGGARGSATLTSRP